MYTKLNAPILLNLPLSFFRHVSARDPQKLREGYAAQSDEHHCNGFSSCVVSFSHYWAL